MRRGWPGGGTFPGGMTLVKAPSEERMGSLITRKTSAAHFCSAFLQEASRQQVGGLACLHFEKPSSESIFSPLDTMLVFFQDTYL